MDILKELLRLLKTNNLLHAFIAQVSEVLTSETCKTIITQCGPRAHFSNILFYELVLDGLKTHKICVFMHRSGRYKNKREANDSIWQLSHIVSPCKETQENTKTYGKEEQCARILISKVLLAGSRIRH
jgi:hypothetical protein